MNQHSHQEPGSEARQTNTGLECVNTGGLGRAQQKVQVQANGQETEEQDRLAGRQKPNSKK